MEICWTAGNGKCPGAAFWASLVTENEGLEILLTLLSDFLGIHLFANQPGKDETALSCPAKIAYNKLSNCTF